VNILFLTDQPFIKAGNQVTYQALRMFASNNDKVFILRPKDLVFDNNALYDPSEIFKNNVFVFYFVNFFESFSKLFRKTLKKEKLLINLPESNEIKSFEGTRSNPFLSDLRFFIQNLFIFNLGKKIIEKNNIDLIFSLEVGVSSGAHRLAKKYKLPCVSKYMGSIVFPYLENNMHSHVKTYLRAYKEESILHFMLNDGTRGDEIFELINADTSKLKFRIDPVDINKFEIAESKEVAIKKMLDHRIKKNDIIFLTLSNHNAQYKRIDRIIRGFDACNLKNAKLIICGNGLFTPSYKELAKGNEDIIFLEKISHEKIPLLFKGIDVYVNCNDQSNLSHTTLEAMAAGKLVLTMNDESIKGILTHGKNSLLIGLDNIHHNIINLINLIHQDQDLIQSLGEEAKNFALQNFMTWDEKNLIEYKEIIEAMNEYEKRK